MNNSLIDAMRFVFREPKEMYEAQCCIVGFLRVFDFGAPCSCTGR